MKIGVFEQLFYSPLPIILEYCASFAPGTGTILLAECQRVLRTSAYVFSGSQTVVVST
jgi:hypothetical protein